MSRYIRYCIFAVFGSVSMSLPAEADLYEAVAAVEKQDLPMENVSNPHVDGTNRWSATSGHLFSNLWEFSSETETLVGIAGLAIFLASWTAVGVGYLIGVDKVTWVVLVVIAACASEGLFWCVAFMLGVGIVEARSKIWGWLKEPFRRRPRLNASER